MEKLYLKFQSDMLTTEGELMGNILPHKAFPNIVNSRRLALNGDINLQYKNTETQNVK
jgi:hypothetical protein